MSILGHVKEGIAERILDNILGLIRVVHNSDGDTQEAGIIGLGELRECRSIACSGALDQNTFSRTVDRRFSLSVSHCYVLQHAQCHVEKGRIEPEPPAERPGVCMGDGLMNGWVRICRELAIFLLLRLPIVRR